MRVIYKAPHEAFSVLKEKFMPNSDFTIRKDGEVIVWEPGKESRLSGFCFKFLTTDRWGELEIEPSRVEIF